MPPSIQESILCYLCHTIFKLSSLRVFSHMTVWHWVGPGKQRKQKENNGSVHLDHLMKDTIKPIRHHHLFCFISYPNRDLVPLTQWSLND